MCRPEEQPSQPCKDGNIKALVWEWAPRVSVSVKRDMGPNERAVRESDKKHASGMDRSPLHQLCRPQWQKADFLKSLQHHGTYFPQFPIQWKTASLSHKFALESHDWQLCHLPISNSLPTNWLLCQACFKYWRWNYSIQEDKGWRESIFLKENCGVVTWKRVTETEQWWTPH